MSRLFASGGQSIGVVLFKVMDLNNNDSGSGKFPGGQWFGLHTFIAVTWVQSLVWELKSCKGVQCSVVVQKSGSNNNNTSPVLIVPRHCSKLVMLVC